MRRFVLRALSVVNTQSIILFVVEASGLHEMSEVKAWTEYAKERGMQGVLKPAV